MRTATSRYPSWYDLRFVLDVKLNQSSSLHYSLPHGSNAKPQTKYLCLCAMTSISIHLMTQPGFKRICSIQAICHMESRRSIHLNLSVISIIMKIINRFNGAPLLSLSLCNKATSCHQHRHCQSLNMRVTGAPQMTLQSVFYSFRGGKLVSAQGIWHWGQGYEYRSWL